MKYNYLNTNRFFISIIPISLIFSIFLADLIVSLSSLFFLVFIIKEKKIILLKCIEFKLFLIFYLICVVSAISSEFSIYSLLKTIPYIRFGLFLILVKFLLTNDIRFKIFFFNSLLITFGILIFGLILQIFEVEFISKFVNGSRYSSFFFDELIMGSYLVKTLPLALSILFYKKKINISLIIIFVTSLCIILSGERSAVFSLFFILSFMFFFSNFINLKKKLISVVLLLVFICSSLYLLPKVKFKLIDQTAYQLSLIEPEKDYMEVKIEDNIVAVAREEYFIPLKYYLMMNSAYKIFKDNIFFGSGIKSFKILCKDKRYYKKKNYKAFENKEDNYYEGYTGLDSCSTHPHNYYIQLLSETGIFSFIIVFSIFIFSFYKFFREKNNYLKILYLSLAVNLFPFYFTGNFFNNFICILLFLNISFLNLDKKNKNDKYISHL